MSNTVFPNTIPLPSSVSFSDVETRSVSQAGAATARSRGLKTITRYKVSFDLSDAHSRLFDAYYNTTLQGGQDSFVIKLPGQGGILQRKVKFISGLIRDRNVNVGFIYSAELESL